MPDTATTLEQMSTTAHPTLAEYLRARGDDELVAILRSRPDLATPLPGDFSALAQRACSPTSLARAVEKLTLFQCEVLDGVRLLPQPRTTKRLSELLEKYDVPPELVQAALHTLESLALVWQVDGVLHTTSGLDEVCGHYPAGLGRPLRAIAPHSSIDDAFAALEQVPAESKAVLNRLAQGPPVGAVNTEAGPTQWLRKHGLLIDLPGDRPEALVELPREIGLALRGDQPLGPLHSIQPALAGRAVDQHQLDAFAVGAVAELLRHAEELLNICASQPPAVLRSGGLGVKEQRRLSGELAVSTHQWSLLMELCAAAGLLGNNNDFWLPTHLSDSWRAQSPQHRWAALAAAWLTLPRLPHLAGVTTERGRIAPLSYEMNRTGSPRLRAALLGAVCRIEPGHSSTMESVRTAVHWRHPRLYLAAAGETVITAMWREAEQLGIFSRGGISTFGRTLVTGADLVRASEDSAEQLAPLLPAPIDYILVQPDLTIVAPGPLEADLAAALAEVADVESSGGATVYRVSTTSVQRGLSYGRSAREVHELFTKRSRTPIPQSLTYLIDDVARKFAAVRVGSAGAYLRSDDELRLTTMLADKRLAALQLRRLAPTVLISPLSAHLLGDLLSDAGYLSAPEDTSGALMVKTVTRRRADASHVPPPTATPLALDESTVRESLQVLRRGDQALLAARSQATEHQAEQDMDAVLAILSEAVRGKALVDLGYIDPHGSIRRRTVRPMSLSGGYLRAEDFRGHTELTFAIHRLASAHPQRPGDTARE